jgi:heme exporter protein C
MNSMMLWFHKMGSPPYFYAFAQRWKPWFLYLSLLGFMLGLYFGFKAPADYLQGESYRIIFIHVPSAWMGQFIFAVMALSGLIALVWHIKIAEMMAMASAPIGATFTAIALLTGSLWGRPTWGTYWVWDARLTSTLILFFLYLGVMGLFRAIEEPRKAARAASLLSLLGVINLPIIHYSVKWWNTLHQGPSLSVLKMQSSIDSKMLWPLLIMALATKFYYAYSVLARAQVMLLTQERGKAWVQSLIHKNDGKSNAVNS